MTNIQESNKSKEVNSLSNDDAYSILKTPLSLVGWTFGGRKTLAPPDFFLNKKFNRLLFNYFTKVCFFIQ